MKQQQISMPSTNPQQYLYTDFSVLSPASHPKHSLYKILNYIKNILKMRLYLCFRDIEQLYVLQPQFFNRTFSAYSSEQLWKKINKNNQQELHQRQMIGFLTKIVLSLTKQKNQSAQNKNYGIFAQLKSTIEWFEDKIVQFQKLIRDKIKQFAMKKRILSKQKRQKFFEDGVNKIKQQMEKSMQEYQLKIAQRHRKQVINKEKDITQTIKKQAYIYQPSKKLSQAKDQSLLIKLAPYKNQKKRPFECKSLQNQLQKTVEEGRYIKKRQIEEFQQLQRQKLKNRHTLEKDVYLSKLELKNNQTLIKLESRRNELNKSQHIKMQKLLQQNYKITNDRINALKKSLRSYSIRDESKQIREIMKHHRQAIQFVNNIQQIADTSKHGNNFSPKYITLDVSTERTKQKKAQRYNQQRLQKRIIRKIKNQTEFSQYDQSENQLKNRRSLAKLYDEQLKQV